MERGGKMEEHDGESCIWTWHSAGQINGNHEKAREKKKKNTILDEVTTA